MKTISRYIMTLALLLTAVTGAWAQSTLNVVEFAMPAAWETDESPVTAADLPGFKAVSLEEGQDWKGAPDKGTAVLVYAFDGDKVKYINFEDGIYDGYVSRSLPKKTIFGNSTSIKFYYTAEPTDPPIEVTTNAASAQDLFTEAKFNMPAFDATVDYELVRDMQDETNPVAFSGLPISGNIVVKKGDDGKYQPAEALTIQLIDPLADNADIITADGITVKVLVGDDSTGPVDYDLVSPITLEAFLADMKPGYYRITAESTDENSPYDGIVYSSEFTAVEQYDLTVKPANDFSKGKIESVTVGTETVTPDATTGEATKTGIAPDTEVKLKAKRGYVIEKVEAKKTSMPN